MTGVPTITTNVGPVSELLEPYNCCIVIDTKNLTSNLEAALIRVFKMSLQEKEEMSKRAIELVKKYLDWDILGKKLNEEINKL